VATRRVLDGTETNEGLVVSLLVRKGAFLPSRRAEIFSGGLVDTDLNAASEYDRRGWMDGPEIVRRNEFVGGGVCGVV
jgi:hypothetical protein